jgi:hypothetical protein
MKMKSKKDKGEPIDWVLERNKFGVYQWKPVYRQYSQLQLGIGQGQ